MATYISILRGINVSGKNIIKMETLRNMYESLGFKNCVTYIQSGNVVFESKKTTPEKLVSAISSAIEKEFGFEVPVLVLTVETLQEIINQNPFVKDKKKDVKFFHVTFLAELSGVKEYDSILDKGQAGEEIAITSKAVYLYCPKGYGNTKWTNTFLESKLKVKATTRNWKTTLELLKMAGEE
ncbi:MAG: DUF1697 domain-containing protein [Cytophagaceae bacterium]